ncbi:unnamed protein product [Cylicocyclus nassatus]|uniref:Uncharacterized protein n=1 Tax=Cylicocyclus nassatus TaxID=53992 RepID=A0AA36GNQ4_CYLNA|nr:unnamed protein product [Cylicocyclus nassatus]
MKVLTNKIEELDSTSKGPIHVLDGSNEIGHVIYDGYDGNDDPDPDEDGYYNYEPVQSYPPSTWSDYNEIEDNYIR